MTKQTETPKCPHCGYEFDDDDVWYGDQDVETGDCDTSELKCLNLDCGKGFRVVCVHLIRFEAADDD